jgi:phage/plasmid-like protein (TIGR03299 family)
MAHEVETMMYVGATPWHGIGKKLEKAPDTETAIVEAGLDWTVHREPLYRKVTLADQTELQEVEAQCVVRDSDGKIITHSVGPEWREVQNRVTFKWFDPWVQQGLVTLETAGSLRGGQIVWVLAKVVAGTLDIGKGDPVDLYVLLANGHGRMAVRSGLTGTRVVCMNTLSISINSSESQLVRLSHTKNVVENLTKLREVIDVARGEFAATAEQYKWLAGRGINQEDLRRYVRVITDKTESERKETKTEAKIIQLFETGRGSDLPTAKGTWWGAYNAVTEFLTWERGKSQAGRLDNVWFGQGKSFNKRALDTALRLAA